MYDVWIGNDYGSMQKNKITNNLVEIDIEGG